MNRPEKPAQFYSRRGADLVPINWRKALDLWNEGFDTVDIGKELGLPEHVIANNLHKWRSVIQERAA